MRETTLLGQISDIDIRLLRVFKSVAESGGMAAAELELNIGRSTISRHIKDLEIRLGVVLCSRGRAGFKLTAEGEQIYQATLNLLASLDAFRGRIADVHRELTGKLSIALFDKTATNPDAKISLAIEQFMLQAPEVELHVHVAPLNQIEAGVMDGRYHLGVIPTHRASSSLDYYPLFDEKMSLYCGHRHPLYASAGSAEKQEVYRQRYAGLGYHSPNMEISHQFDLQRTATAYDQEGIATLLLSGAFVGFLPDHYAASFVANGQMRAIGGSHFGYHCHFAAISRREPKPSRLVQRFLDRLIQCHLRQ